VQGSRNSNVPPATTNSKGPNDHNSGGMHH